MLNVGLEGDDRFRIVIEALEAHAALATKRSMYRIANILAGRIRDTIIRQTEEWPPLSKPYARWKEKHGFDLRLLRVTGQYVQGIVPRREGDLGYSIRASSRPHVDPRTGRPDPHLPMTLLSVYLEYGFDVTRDGRRYRMPPRPHFRPVYRDFQRHLDTEKNKIQEEIWGELRDKVVMGLQNSGVEHG